MNLNKTKNVKNDKFSKSMRFQKHEYSIYIKKKKNEMNKHGARHPVHYDILSAQNEKNNRDYYFVTCRFGEICVLTLID